MSRWPDEISVRIRNRAYHCRREHANLWGLFRLEYVLGSRDESELSGEDLMSVSSSGEPGKGSKAGALSWTRQGHSPLEPAVIAHRSGFPFPDCPGCYPEGVTRLVMCR